MLKIYFSVGEPSGDLHGANLIRELKERDPGIICVGYGGPQMASAGCQLQFDLTRLAVMWFWLVLRNLHQFFALWRRADHYFRMERPDAVVLIDYPGFNWWIARSAKKYGIPVFYYGVPQMWAWAGWRVKKIQRFVDHVLCKLPFEPQWFRERGCAATYVGHPYFDELHSRQPDHSLVSDLRRGDPLITILPGSRTQEIFANLPTLIRAAACVWEKIPKVQFAIASFNERQAAIAQRMVARAGLPIEIYAGRTPELIEAAHCCMACSGSVSLELLYHEKPSVVVYAVSRLGLFVTGIFRRVKYITLANLLASNDLFPPKVVLYDPDDPQAERVPMPEYLTSQDKSKAMAMAGHVIRWLTEASSYDASVAMLRQLKQRYAIPGASRAAAAYILQEMAAKRASRQVPIPRPHFDPRHAA